MPGIKDALPDLLTVEAFVCAARLGSVARAAASMNCAASVVSRRISELERVLGGHLFERTGRGVTLTALGAAQLPPAEELLDAAAQFVEQARGDPKGPAGTVRIALPRWVIAGSFENFYLEVSKRWPRIDLVVREGYSREIEEWLVSGAIDVCVLNTWRRTPAYDAELIQSDNLILAGPAGSALLRSPQVPFSVLHRLPLALPPLPNIIHSALVNAARAHHVEINIRFQSTNGKMIKDAVRNGIYAVQTSFISAAAYADPDIETAEIIEPSIPIHTYVVAAPGRANGRAIEAIRVFLCELLRNFGKDGSRLGT